MDRKRREFLTAGCIAAVTNGAIYLGLAPAAQPQRPSRPPVQPAQQNPETQGNDPSPPPSTKKALQENEKDLKKSVEKLFQLASDLKTEVEKTDSVNVLSLAMLRKADEIEHLARDIKNRAKG